MLKYTYILKKFEKVTKYGKKGEILKSCTQKLKIKTYAKLTHSLLQYRTETSSLTKNILRLVNLDGLS